MRIALAFLRLTGRGFLDFAVALILFWLPADILFRLSSWKLFMPTGDIVSEVAMLILVVTLFSAGLAVSLAGISCLLVALFFRNSIEKAQKTLAAGVPTVTVAIIAILVFRISTYWAIRHYAIAFTSTTPLVALLVIVVLVTSISKHGLLVVGDTLHSRLARGKKAIVALIVAASVFVGAKGIALHDYAANTANSAQPPRNGMPNVILISIDTLSAEDMSLYGYPLPTTPKLDAFAKESFVFDNFFSSSNWTTPSVASFLSGTYPSTNGVNYIYSYFLEKDRKKNLAQALHDNGYGTLAVVANNYAHPLTLRISDSFSATTELPVRNILFADPIFHELFRLKDYRTHWVLVAWLEPLLQTLLYMHDEERSLWPPELVFERTTAFFATMKRPSFIWSHIMPPHLPYLPAAPFKYKFESSHAFANLKDYETYGGEYPPDHQDLADKARLRYDEFILDTDSRIGVFLDRLRDLGRFDDSIIVITADHGESFTKNYLSHGGHYLHQSLIHIPLMIHLPRQKEGKHLPVYGGQVDLLPTIMDLLDLPIPSWTEGESLKPAMLEGKSTSMPKFSMNLDTDSRFAPPRTGIVAVMYNGWKFVRHLDTGREELFDLAQDPQETSNLVNVDPARKSQMTDLIESRFRISR